jgi:energy-coupling factor transporter transmembrane protein EcfT
MLCRDPLALAVAWLAILVPLLTAGGVARQHARFVGTILGPITVALLFVWGWLIGAAPGEPLRSSPAAGLRFAEVTSLRLAVLGGLFQVCFLTIPRSELVLTLRSWGVRGQGLVIALSTLTLVPELGLRTRQVLTARFARGLASNQRWLQQLYQFPSLLPPLMAWVLRSAIQRGECWEQRHLLEQFFEKPGGQPQRVSFASVLLVLVAAGWLAFNLFWQLAYSGVR